MTYEECLEICTKRMAVMGYFPHEIAAAAYYHRIVHPMKDDICENEMLYEMEEDCI